ncbi:MAG: c-type cytochrome [Candidatus Binatia bacterium]
MKVIVFVFVIAGIATGVPAAERPVTDLDAMAGKALYVKNCSGCHGERGDGAGPAADFVDPRPRDFTKHVFKFRTTPSGQPPMTADILRVIERGVPGTAMPSFAFLPEADRKKMAAYVLQVADLIDGQEPTPFADPGAIPAATPETIAKGKQFYVDAGCAACHGDAGKGDGPSANGLADGDGRPIKPRDFTTGVYRGGSDAKDVFYRIACGMDGTPMPAFGDVIEKPDLIAVVHYLQSLQAKPTAQPLPSDPVAAGRAVAARYSCQGCHVLDDGKGGAVGPDFRLVSQKLSPEWVRTFLKSPDGYGKIYPWRPYVMPRLGIKPDEIDAMAKYFAAVGKREDKPLVLPDPKTFPAAKLEEGKNLFVLRCAQCHTLGKVIETPLAAQQGPDLIKVAGRVDYAWAREWIINPKKFDPNTRMQVTDITPDQVDSVRMFVWKTAMETGGGQ